MLLEYCETYFKTNKRRLSAMFDASVPHNFFENRDEESYSDLKISNIFEVKEEETKEDG